MADAYAALVDDLGAEHAALDDVVAPLTEAQWAQLTPAAGWTIRDSVAHLAVTDHVAALAAADPAGFADYRAARSSGTDPFAAARTLPGPALLEAWRTNRQALLAALRPLDARQRVTWFGPPMSAMSHATARLMETWAHGQDVRDTLGLEGPDTARLQHIAHLGVRTRNYSFAQHDLPPPTTDVYVALDGPAGAQWTWGEPDAPDRVRGPARDFCLVVVQRRHLDDTALETTGPHAREWLLIAQAFAGRAGPGREPRTARS